MRLSREPAPGRSECNPQRGDRPPHEPPPARLPTMPDERPEQLPPQHQDRQPGREALSRVRVYLGNPYEDDGDAPE